jgi:hypothetical protein
MARPAPGVVVPPMPTRPCESTIRAVVVAVAVEVDTRNAGIVPILLAPTDSFACGVAVPIPKLFEALKINPSP